MDLLEYQGKQQLARYGVAVPEGGWADDPEAAVAVADRLGYPVVVKAQVPVGGRGKAGGIKRAADRNEAASHAGAILGMDIGGQQVRRLWIERASDIALEYYASFTLDRRNRRHVGMVSARGGVDIEVVAAEEPSAVARLQVDPLDGLSLEEAERLVADARLESDVAPQVAGLLLRLFTAYAEGDAELVEVNPLAVTADRQVLALDAKVALDESAAFRHPEWTEWRGDEGLDERERLAREKGLNYVGLDGTVGIIGNGAGLVMATLDVVHQAGGSAANFLDVGGGASADVVAAALELVNHDAKVRVIFVNIFGGITRGEQVAAGIVEALGRVDVRSPIVVRLDGTNAPEGRAILAAHPSDRLISEETMLSAARRAVGLAAVDPPAVDPPAGRP